MYGQRGHRNSGPLSWSVHKSIFIQYLGLLIRPNLSHYCLMFTYTSKGEAAAHGWTLGQKIEQNWNFWKLNPFFYRPRGGKHFAHLSWSTCKTIFIRQFCWRCNPNMSHYYLMFHKWLIWGCEYHFLEISIFSTQRYFFQKVLKRISRFTL